MMSDALNFSFWYPLFSNHTFESRVIPLSWKFVQHLESDGIVVNDTNRAFPNYVQESSDDDDVETNWDTEETAPITEFKELESEITKAIAEYGSVFPKLNSQAPKVTNPTQESAPYPQAERFPCNRICLQFRFFMLLLKFLTFSLFR